ncbi:hypothetical protein KQI49_09750 [Virgibacillus sp. MSJ-26]|uniref:hypothetical protein n=1 Tax=Virgibacillus sp. MSJ-26 TaxID=2841522 RepID=UPI001C0FD4D9|nr:hypothetical protein [Virgibacillus sp. MSJ-26]MBU5467105.1 hypothetical protein [Virgibacillus sp. MSJ-26]
MKFRDLVVKKGLIIIGLLVLIVGGLLFASQSYFSHLEVKNITEKCYEDGGLPTIEKSGFKIVHFSCDKG